MIQKSDLLFLTVETPLHAGSGRGLGTVDMPVQRERTTGYPMVQSSGLKGCLRAEARLQWGEKSADLETLFGPDTGNAAEHAGALLVGDARLLLFPVRSLAGVFAYATSADALARFRRTAELIGLDLKDLPEAPKVGKEEAVVNKNSSLLVEKDVVLEEFSFTAVENEQVGKIGDWLAEHALPANGYTYWKAALQSNLCILPEDAFRDFTLYATEVQTHIKLNPETKTVVGTALFTSEHLPIDSLLYAPLMATQSRKDKVALTAEQVLTRFGTLNLAHVQLGGDETTGQGWVSLNVVKGQ
jgi:CRISPR-associated protein Cmr4